MSLTNLFHLIHFICKVYQVEKIGNQLVAVLQTPHQTKSASVTTTPYLSYPFEEQDEKVLVGVL